LKGKEQSSCLFLANVNKKKRGGEKRDVNPLPLSPKKKEGRGKERVNILLYGRVLLTQTQGRGWYYFLFNRDGGKGERKAHGLGPAIHHGNAGWGGGIEVFCLLNRTKGRRRTRFYLGGEERGGGAEEIYMFLSQRKREKIDR